MRSQPSVSIAVVGSVAAAATTGALIAIGRRLGDVALPFAAIGGVVLPRAGGGAGLVLTGVVLHVAVMLLWSVLFVRLAERLASDAVSAATIAASHFVVSWIVAWISARGLSSALTLGDRIAFAVVLAGALVVGMRFAFSFSRNA